MYTIVVGGYSDIYVQKGCGCTIYTYRKHLSYFDTHSHAFFLGLYVVFCLSEISFSNISSLGFFVFHAKRRMRIFRMRCATDHEPCRHNLATLESTFGGNGGGGEEEEEISNNNLDECAEALDMVNDHDEKAKLRNNVNEVIHMETVQSRVTYHREDTPSSPSKSIQGSYFDDF